MRRIVYLSLLLFGMVLSLSAQERFADLKFTKTVHDFGTFSEKEKKSCVFEFTNKGNLPLIINQVLTSCGCTVAKYVKEPIPPGGKGQISVTYDGKGKFPGPFHKTITVRSNSKMPLMRIYIEGDMEEEATQKKK